MPRLSRPESGRQGRSRGRSADRRERHLQRHPAPERRQRLGRRTWPDARQDPPDRSQDLRGRSLRAAIRSGRRASSATHRAASTSIRTASSGPRWRAAATWPASIAASARARCRARRRRAASTAAKAGRCIRCPGRDSRACAATWPWTSSITTSWTASTRSASATNVPFANGTNSDSLLALQPDGTWLVLRVPYPLGFFSRGMDGRIDDREGGVEGPRHLCGLRTERRLAHGRRPRHAERCREVPAAARSAGEVGEGVMRFVHAISLGIGVSALLVCSRSRTSIFPAAGRSGSTRICPNAGPDPTSATTSGCRSTTPRACVPTRGTRANGRCWNGSASRTRPTTHRAARRACASAAPSIPCRRT